MSILGLLSPIIVSSFEKLIKLPNKEFERYLMYSAVSVVSPIMSPLKFLYNCFKVLKSFLFCSQLLFVGIYKIFPA